MNQPAVPAIKVLMVCLGNICRSPTAEAVLRKLLQQQDLHHQVVVDSAGTSNWHQGAAPDPRSIQAASSRGYDLSGLRARQVVMSDFEQQQYILAMDAQNLRDLERACPPRHQAKLGLLLQYSDNGLRDVPDPYEQSPSAFDQVLDLCEHACEQFLHHLVNTHGLPSQRGRS